MINKTEIKFTAFSITSVRAEQKSEDNNATPKFRINTDKKGQMYFRVKQEENDIGTIDEKHIRTDK